MDEDREQRKIKKIMEIDLISPTRELHSLTAGVRSLAEELAMRGGVVLMVRGNYRTGRRRVT